MRKLRISKTVDFWLVFFWTTFAFILSFYIGINYLITAFLFFVIPSLYLSLRKPVLIKKTAIVSIIILIPATIIFNYLAHQDGSWINFSTIGITLFDSYPIDDFLWGFLYFFYIFIFYEYFFDRDRNKKKIPKAIRQFELVGYGSVALFCFCCYFGQER